MIIFKIPRRVFVNLLLEVVYESVTTALWKAPSTMGVPVAMKNDEHSDRVDYAASQTTSSKIVS